MTPTALFCSIALAERVEAAEVRLMRTLAQLAEASNEPGVFFAPVAGGLAVSGGPDSPITKVLGVGFGDLPRDDELQALESRYADAGVEISFEIPTLANLSFVRQLEQRGYRLQRTELVQGRALSASVDRLEVPEGVTIDEVQELETWVAVSVKGFTASEAPEGRDVAAEVHGREAVEKAAQLFGSMPGARRYLATRQGVAAGAASLRIDEDGIAQCCGATTLMAHRRRGIQTALLYHRLAVAADNGCDLAVITTEPGSRSQANAARHGFSPLYSRLVMSRAGNG